jgi:hypothetical protein
LRATGSGTLKRNQPQIGFFVVVLIVLGTLGGIGGCLVGLGSAESNVAGPDSNEKAPL